MLNPVDFRPPTLFIENPLVVVPMVNANKTEDAVLNFMTFYFFLVGVTDRFA